MAAPAAEAPAKIGLWLLTNGGDGEGQLLRWDPEQTPSADKAVYTGPRYTAQHPDTQGLEACRVLAQELGERYGVDIRLGAEVAEAKDYRFEEEYQVDAYLQGLMALEKALGAYPEGFIATACSGSETGVLHIGLVRSISGDLAGLQYWPDGDAHIALALTGSVERMFHHELCHVLDTYIFANSLAYDQWDDLNPGDFSYSYRYEGYHDLGDSPYLQGEDPAFIDAYSMTYPKEDRARILEYAMEPGQEALFAGSALQAKLRQICLAIREAFGWEEDPRTFPWEQYWKKPVA